MLETKFGDKPLSLWLITCIIYWKLLKNSPFHIFTATEIHRKCTGKIIATRQMLNFRFFLGNVTTIVFSMLMVKCESQALASLGEK